MTKEEIIAMANQAKLPYDYVRGEPMWLDKLEEFAKLVAEKALETKDEPVGWIDSKGYMICVKTDESCRPLYTTPQRTWKDN
jgi:hypothetical protein